MRSLTPLALAAAALALTLSPTPSAQALPAPAAAADIPVGAPVVQYVQIDGRFVKVELVVNRFIGGAPIEPWFPTTTVSVQLSINDGGQLPVGLDAVGVRFEKLRGINRFFFTPLSETGISDPGPEVDAAGYMGDLSDHPSVQYLRTVVRLERNGEVIKVPMGIIHVNTTLLP